MPQNGRCCPPQGWRNTAWTRENSDGNHRSQPPPALPARQLCQTVRPHQPHEMHMRKALLQQSDRFYGEALPKPRFDIRRNDSPSVCNPLRRGKTHPERRHALTGLERIPWRDHEPHLIQAQSPQGPPRQHEMTRMRRIKRPTQQTDPHIPAITRRRNTDQPRTCPVPITSYR